MKILIEDLQDKIKLKDEIEELDFAKKLEREAEKVLGSRGMWNQTLRNPNAAGSRSRQGIADPTLTLDSTF